LIVSKGNQTNQTEKDIDWMALVTGLVCIICGAPFEALVVTKRPRFCSPECKAARMEAQSRRYKREGRYPRAKYPHAIFEKTCTVCGGDFRTEAKGQQTCSRSCGAKLAGRTTGPLLAARARARNERPCPVCHRMFVPSHPSAKQCRAGWVQQTCGDRQCMRACAVRARVSSGGDRVAENLSAEPPAQFLFDLFGPLR
jgi:predicted nucleic acid-binding Zn ribbon protein